MLTSQRPVARLASQRYLSVAAWGRNTSGQCGQGIPEVNPVYEEPVTVSQLEGAVVTSLGIGRNHSAAVVLSQGGGEVWSWGCGKAGKLGHGNSDDLLRPARVEALVGEADIKDVALGHQHTLFLDSEGAVWSCGENKEGQCGFGTPLQAIADQQRAEWEMGRAPWVNGSAFDGGGGRLQQGSAGVSQPSPWTTQQQQARMAWSQHTQPFAMQTEFQRQVEEAQRLLAASGQETSEAMLTQAGTGLDMGRGQGIFAGQSNMPTRIGRDLQGLVSETPQSSGVENEVVSSLAASRFFSALCTQRGGVWTFGGGFNGELGHQSSWATEARSVEGAVLKAIEAKGGAVAVKAGGTFCMCLTQSGEVLFWGSLPGDPQARGMEKGGSRLLEMTGLPRMTHIAAGHSHALMSDGRRVWSMGRWLGADGKSKQGGSWGEAQMVLDLSDETVSSLAAGAQSSAVVSGDGQLYMWGKVLSQDDVTTLRQQSNIFAPDSNPSATPWAGLGSDKPQAVRGLGRVKLVQLGFQHALAVVE